MSKKFKEMVRWEVTVGDLIAILGLGAAGLIWMSKLDAEIALIQSQFKPEINAQVDVLKTRVDSLTGRMSKTEDRVDADYREILARLDTIILELGEKADR